jgi:hypothetical protein
MSMKLGRYDDAIAMFEKAAQPVLMVCPNQTARVYALMGRQREARQLMNGLKGEEHSNAVSTLRSATWMPSDSRESS